MASCIFLRSQAHILRNVNIKCSPSPRPSIYRKTGTVHFHDFCEIELSTIHKDDIKLNYANYIIISLVSYLPYDGILFI